MKCTCSALVTDVECPEHGLIDYKGENQQLRAALRLARKLLAAPVAAAEAQEPQMAGWHGAWLTDAKAFLKVTEGLKND